MSLFGGVTIPGHPDLHNIALLDRLPIPMIRRAHRLGIAISREHLWDCSSQFRGELVELDKDIASYIPPERLAEFQALSEAIEEAEEEETGFSSGFNAGSSEQIGLLLFDMLAVGATKQLKRTKTGQISTGKRQLETVRLDHPVVPKILRHRELTKLINTYSDKLPKLAKFHPRGPSCPICGLKHETDQWRVHGEMGTTRAKTGRINHKNPNLGNIPTRTKDGQLVQAGFIAPPGTRQVDRDLSQIELRGLAHLANCKSMIEVYEKDGDIHDDTCHRALGVPWDEKPDKIKHRMAAKRVNFGIQNGTTEKGLYLQLVMDFGTNGMPIPDWLTEPWCKGFINSWLEARPEVVEYFNECWYRARRYKMAWEPFGRVRLIPEVFSTHSWIDSAGLRQAQNMPVTSFAAGQLKLVMGRVEAYLQQLYDGGIYCWPLMTIHDAIKVECDEKYTDVVEEVMRVAFDECMNDEETGELLMRVPIKSDSKVMERWEK